MVKVTDDPAFLTTAIRPGTDPGRGHRAACLGRVLFAVRVRPPARRPEILTGILTWAATGLDERGSRRDRVWLDFGMPSQRAAELLEQRILEVGEPP